MVKADNLQSAVLKQSELWCGPPAEIRCASCTSFANAFLVSEFWTTFCLFLLSGIHPKIKAGGASSCLAETCTALSWLQLYFLCLDVFLEIVCAPFVPATFLHSCACSLLWTRWPSCSLIFADFVLRPRLLWTCTSFSFNLMPDKSYTPREISICSALVGLFAVPVLHFVSGWFCLCAGAGLTFP